MKAIPFLTLVFFLVPGTVLTANPFQKLQQEINETLPTGDSTVFRIFGNQSQEQEVQKLFSVGVNQTGEEEEVELASLGLPKYISYNFV